MLLLFSFGLTRLRYHSRENNIELCFWLIFGSRLQDSYVGLWFWLMAGSCSVSFVGGVYLATQTWLANGVRLSLSSVGSCRIIVIVVGFRDMFILIYSPSV